MCVCVCVRASQNTHFHCPRLSHTHIYTHACPKTDDFPALLRRLSLGEAAGGREAGRRLLRELVSDPQQRLARLQVGLVAGLLGWLVGDGGVDACGCVVLFRLAVGRLNRVPTHQHRRPCRGGGRRRWPRWTVATTGGRTTGWRPTSAPRTTISTRSSSSSKLHHRSSRSTSTTTSTSTSTSSRHRRQ